MKLLINYANHIFRRSQIRNSETGLSVGGFDEVISYSPEDISRDFYKKNRHILRKERGNGFWLWKFYFIKKSLEQLDDGDFLFYCDAGAHFIASIDPIIELCVSHQQEIIPFEFEYIEKEWTKRDAFKLLDSDTPEYYDTPQRIGGFMLFRKSKYSIDFMSEILELAQDERLITDLKNQLGFPNYPGFIEHRHDQSLWSLLTKKHGLKAFRDPSQYGNHLISIRDDSPYEQLFELTREKQHTKYSRNREELRTEGFRLFVRAKIRNMLQRITGKKRP